MNDEVLSIARMNRDFQENVAAPTQKYDAQLFAIKNTLQVGESERETEFALMQQVMKKLVHALEDKANTEVMTLQAREELESNYTITPAEIIQQKAFGGRKGSHPPPVNRFLNESGLKHHAT